MHGEDKRFYVDRVVSKARDGELEEDIKKLIEEGCLAVFSDESALDTNIPADIFYSPRVLIESESKNENFSSDKSFSFLNNITNEYFFWFHCDVGTKKGDFTEVVEALPTCLQVLERAQAIRDTAIIMRDWSKGRFIKPITNLNSWYLLELDVPCYTVNRSEVLKAARDKRRPDLFELTNKFYLFELCKRHNCPYFLDDCGNLTDSAMLLM